MLIASTYSASSDAPSLRLSKSGMFLGSESTAATLTRAITARLACLAAVRTSGTELLAPVWVQEGLPRVEAGLPPPPEAGDRVDPQAAALVSGGRDEERDAVLAEPAGSLD